MHHKFDAWLASVRRIGHHNLSQGSDRREDSDKRVFQLDRTGKAGSFRECESEVRTRQATKGNQEDAIIFRQLAAIGQPAISASESVA